MNFFEAASAPETSQ